MKKIIEDTLAQKGVTVSEAEVADLTYRWEALHKMKESLADLPLETMEIALQNVPKGGKDEE